MVLLPLFAATALAQTAAPLPAGARAEAVARANIVSPARLIIAPDARSAQIDGGAAPATPRRIERPCDANSLVRCPTVVFDLP